MTWNIFLPYLVVMAGVTYLIRALPLTLVRRQIRNRYVRSFLRYVPYAVLTAMTFPDILYSTGYARASVEPLICAVCGLAVASFMAWKGQGLLPVAIGACAAVACAQGICLLV